VHCLQFTSDGEKARAVYAHYVLATSVVGKGAKKMSGGAMAPHRTITDHTSYTNSNEGCRIFIKQIALLSTIISAVVDGE